MRRLVTFCEVDAMLYSDLLIANTTLCVTGFNALKSRQISNDLLR